MGGGWDACYNLYQASFLYYLQMLFSYKEIVGITKIIYQKIPYTMPITDLKSKTSIMEKFIGPDPNLPITNRQNIIVPRNDIVGDRIPLEHVTQQQMLKQQMLKQQMQKQQMQTQQMPPPQQQQMPPPQQQQMPPPPQQQQMQPPPQQQQMPPPQQQQQMQKQQIPLQQQQQMQPLPQKQMPTQQMQEPIISDYVFHDSKYTYLNSDNMLFDFSSTLSNSQGDIKAHFIPFKLNDNCKLPFLSFLLDNNGSQIVADSVIIEKNIFSDTSLDVNLVFETMIKESFQRKYNVTNASYKGYLDFDRSTIYVFFETQETEETKPKIWTILDEIVNEKKVLQYAVDSSIIELFRRYPYIGILYNESGEQIPIPSCLYLCKQGEQEEYINILTDENENSIIEPNINHPIFGIFQYFSSYPIMDTAEGVKRYAVFIDEALYIFNETTPLPQSDDNDVFTNYDCIRFKESERVMWCVKNINRFTAINHL